MKLAGNHQKRRSDQNNKAETHEYDAISGGVSAKVFKNIAVGAEASHDEGLWVVRG